MAAEPGARRIRRVLVAMDATAHHPAWLDAVVEVAAQLRAELVGLLVEDVNLLRLAELPFTRQVSLLTAIQEHNESAAMRRELRAIAARTERRLAAAAEMLQVKASFRVVRGLAAPEVRAAAEDADLLVVEAVTRPFSRQFRLSEPVRVAARELRRPVLLLRPRVSLRCPVLVVHDGSESGAEALATAAGIALHGPGLLEVLLLTEPAGAAAAEQAAREQVRGLPLDLRCRPMPDPGLTRLRAVVDESRCGLLVIAADCALLREVQPEALLERLDCPVLVVH